MQKGRKKQAKYPFGVMKEERKKEDEDEKQELEFAEGFRRIKNVDFLFRLLKKLKYSQICKFLG